MIRQSRHNEVKSRLGLLWLQTRVYGAVLLFFISPPLHANPTDLELKAAYCYGVETQIATLFDKTAPQNQMGIAAHNLVKKLSDYMLAKGYLPAGKTPGDKAMVVTLQQGVLDEAGCEANGCIQQCTSTSDPKSPWAVYYIQGCMGRCEALDPRCVSSKKCETMSQELPY